jgi:hypothetical protein
MLIDNLHSFAINNNIDNLILIEINIGTFFELSLYLIIN